MFNSHHIRRYVAGCGVALALLGSTAAAAQPVDPFPRPVATPRQDLRSPDARDAADATVPRQDLRSGDARDANSFYRPVIPPTAPAAVSTTDHHRHDHRLADDRFWPRAGTCWPSSSRRPRSLPLRSGRRRASLPDVLGISEGTLVS